MRGFVSWRLCLIVFKTFSDRSGIRTHAHTRVPELSTEEFLESGALDPRPSCRVYADIFLYDLCFFNWVEFAFQRFNLISGFCHPFQKICVSTHAYIRVSHVSAGYLLFCALINRSAVVHGWRCDSFLFWFGLSSSHNVPVWQNLSAEGCVSSCSKRFLTRVGFEPTHTLVYQNSRLRNFMGLAPETIGHPAGFTPIFFCMICAFSIRLNLHFRDLFR